MRAQVCELDIMFNLEKAHFILDEMCVDPAVRACSSRLRARFLPSPASPAPALRRAG